MTVQCAGTASHSSATNLSSRHLAGEVISWQRLSDLDELAELRSEWNGINPDDDCPFRKWQWLENWWRVYAAPHRKLFTITARSGTNDRLIAVLPLFIEQSWLKGNSLRFLGSGEVCTDYNTMMVRPGESDRSAALFARVLAQDFDGAFDRIELQSVLPADAAIVALTNSLRNHGFRVERRVATACWCAELNPSWETYLASISRGRRARSRRIHREYFENGRTRVFLANDEETFRRGFDILVKLHQQRRQSLGQRGCFTSSRFQAFLRAAGRDLLRSGCLDLQWIEMDGLPIAAQFDLRDRHKVYHYQSGFAPSAAKHRPGWQAVMTALQRACDRGATHFDFLRGDEPYKVSWGAAEVPQEDITLIPPRLRARTRYAADGSLCRIRQQIGKLLRRCGLRAHS